MFHGMLALLKSDIVVSRGDDEFLGYAMRIALRSDTSYIFVYYNGFHVTFTHMYQHEAKNSSEEEIMDEKSNYPIPILYGTQVMCEISVAALCRPHPAAEFDSTLFCADSDLL
mmetsp:Transcript_22362/g.32752  ORF Transcript_22362/g.32752 Transcript_22362/m.32752 type:complete len:113 (-) Transcript_22362:259-597(-)